MASTRKLGAMGDKTWRKGEAFRPPPMGYTWYWFEGLQFSMPEALGDQILRDHELVEALTLEVNALSERLTLALTRVRGGE